jgi:flagellar assembly protein FliH
MSGVIKAGDWQGGGDSLRSVAFNLEDISERAKHYLDSVRREASEIVSKAKQDAQQLQDRAVEGARQVAAKEAEQAFQVKLDEQLQTVLPAVQQAVAAIAQSQQAWLKHWERQTVRLACAISERVIRRELRQSPDISLELIREALELSMGGGRLRLHLNPQDYEAIRSHVSTLTAQIQDLAEADVVADPDVGLGGCRVVTEFGTVDQQIETQLARIEEELT